MRISDWSSDVCSSDLAITGQSAEEVQKVVTDAQAVDPDSQYAQLTRGLSTEQYRALTELGIPFLYFTPHPSRTYPDGAVAGNLVGFVGTDGDALAGLEQVEKHCHTATAGVLRFQRGQDGAKRTGKGEE